MTFVEVVVNRPTHHRPPPGSPPERPSAPEQMVYTYRLPGRLREKAAVGQLVHVPFGASNALGIVVALTDVRPHGLDRETIRDVDEILDRVPVVTRQQIALARWIAGYYLEPLSQAMRLFLPPGLYARTFVVVTTTRPSSQRDEASLPQDLSADEKAALRIVRNSRGRVRLSNLVSRLTADDPEDVIHSLADRGLLEARYAFVPPRPAPPRVQYARIVADGSSIEAALPTLGRPSIQADLLLALARGSGAPVTKSELCDLVGCSPASAESLAKRGWVKITEQRRLVMAEPVSRDGTAPDLSRAPKQKAAWSQLLEHGSPVEVTELAARASVSPSVIYQLERKGLVRRIVEPSHVLLTLPPEQVLDKVIELRGAEKERAVLAQLRGTKGRVWVGGLYAATGATLATLKKLAAMGLISLHAKQYDRPSPIDPQAPPRLTPEQAAVWDELRARRSLAEEAHESFVVLFHGVTGSGKTEIYLRALASTLDEGKRAIVLVPEISLTAQTVRRFESRFPGRVEVLHSRLSAGRRYAVWDRVRRGHTDVLIGPRSALMSPMSRLGLIVVDEAHDDSYKQDEPIPLPAYDARAAAVALGRLTGATVILGSATPGLDTYHQAVQGPFHLLELPHRVVLHALSDQKPRVAAPRPGERLLPRVRVVDLRQELRAGNRSILSRALQERLRLTLQADEQAILFLNRRGMATFVLCRDCGYVARCPSCDIPLTFHSLQVQGLVCHRCNHRQPVPSRCPECGGRRIRFFGLGTEQVEDTVRQLFPRARLLRWDADTASASDHEAYLQAFIDHRADVLIGTQMIAKGLDLPLVTLVGVISADTALNLPDYRAAERTFQLLTQVAGRAGRSTRGGQAIIQTYNPDHYAIRAAAEHSFAAFWEKEAAYRRTLGYPPFGRLLALRCRDKDRSACQAEAQRVASWLAHEMRRLNLSADLIGPAPCFFSRVQGYYRWQVVIRSHQAIAPFLQGVAFPRGWRVDVDPVTLL